MAGKIVETNYGKGKTKNEDKPDYGKMMVYLDSGKNMILNSKNVKVIGKWD